MENKKGLFLKDNKNMFLLLLIVSPMIGFLYRLTSLPLSLGVLLGILLGLPLALGCCELIGFRTWTITALVIGTYGILLILTWNAYAFGIIGAVLLGLSLASLLLLMPQVILIEEYKNKGLLFLCLFWTFAISIGLFLGNAIKTLSERFIYYYLLLFLLESVFSLYSLGQKEGTKAIQKPYLMQPQILYRRNKASQIKLFVFSFIVNFILFSSLFIYQDIAKTAYTGAINFFTNNYLLSGIFIGFFISQWILNSYNIMALIVTIILSAQLESAILFSTGNTSLLTLGQFLLGFSLGQWLISMPLISYYLVGPFYFSQYLTTALMSMPIGIICSFTFVFYTNSSDPWFVFTNYLFIFLLIFSFFTIFSAWRRRLVLLTPCDMCYT